MTKLFNIKDYRYLIIGGTTKAATTSLYYYLAAHPQICESNWKETSFFLDPDYPMAPKKHRFEDGLGRYEEFFNHCSYEKVRMEATPQYLYSLNTPKKIRDSLPKAKILFSLREPISRLISWYKFNKQRGLLSERITLNKYIEKQVNTTKKISQNERIIEQGRYSRYLSPYFDSLGPDRIHVIFYEDLSRDPGSVLKEICLFAEIDPDFYNEYDFKIFNRSETIRSTRLHQTYINLRFYVNQYTRKRRRINHALRKFWLHIKPLYLRVNRRMPEELEISPTLKVFLDEYYRQEVHTLADLLKRSTPWES